MVLLLLAFLLWQLALPRVILEGSPDLAAEEIKAVAAGGPGAIGRGAASCGVKAGVGRGAKPGAGRGAEPNAKNRGAGCAVQSVDPHLEAEETALTPRL